MSISSAERGSRIEGEYFSLAVPTFRTDESAGRGRPRIPTASLDAEHAEAAAAGTRAFRGGAPAAYRGSATGT